MLPDMLYYVNVWAGFEWLRIEPEPAPVFAEDDWLENALGDWLCSECRCVNRQKFPEPLDISLAARPQGETSALVELTNLTLWRRDFIAEMGSLADDFIVGKCLLSNGEVIEDYITCYSRDYIVPRGSQNAMYRVCSVCGTVLADVRTGAEYILERYLKNCDVFQDAMCRFYLTEQAAYQHDLQAYEDVFFKLLSVRKTPMDGQQLPDE